MNKEIFNNLYIKIILKFVHNIYQITFKINTKLNNKIILIIFNYYY